MDGGVALLTAMRHPEAVHKLVRTESFKNDVVVLYYQQK
jgi:hypothetical protein